VYLVYFVVPHSGSLFSVQTRITNNRVVEDLADRIPGSIRNGDMHRDSVASPDRRLGSVDPGRVRGARGRALLDHRPIQSRDQDADRGHLEVVDRFDCDRLLYWRVKFP
jgi:hypothetical protein